VITLGGRRGQGGIRKRGKEKRGKGKSEGRRGKEEMVG